jgi:hypothetical protein
VGGDKTIHQERTEETEQQIKFSQLVPVKKPSNDEHRISVAEEAVVFADGFGVGGKDEFAAGGLTGSGKGADEHEQCGAGQVEVGEKPIHDLEGIRRINKNAGAATAGNECPVILGGDRFEHTNSRCADSNDAAVRGFGFVDEARSVGAEFVALFVHRVAGERIGFDGRKRAEADVQCDEASLNAACTNLGEERFGKMKTSGRCSDRAGRRGIYGLVTKFVGCEVGGIFSFDVRRQRNFAERNESVADVWRAGKFETAMAFVVCVSNFGANARRISGGIEKNHFRADAGAFAGAKHRPPIVEMIFFEQKNFELSRGARIDAAKASGNDARVVEGEDIAGKKLFEQIGKAAMRDFFRRALQDEKARFIARRSGNLCDQFGRQKKIKIGRLHLQKQRRKHSKWVGHSLCGVFFASRIRRSRVEDQPVEKAEVIHREERGRVIHNW